MNVYVSSNIENTQTEMMRSTCEQKQEAGDVLTSARGSTPCLISLSAIGSALSASRLAPGCSVPSVKFLVRGTASSLIFWAAGLIWPSVSLSAVGLAFWAILSAAGSSCSLLNLSAVGLALAATLSAAGLS